MSTRADFDRVNGESAFPDHIEGYWRQAVWPDKDKLSSNYDRKVASYPWPVVFDVEGYNKDEFVGKLVMLKQLDPNANVVNYRGFSVHRITGAVNGIGEYVLYGWTWPTGYMAYLSMGVPPSRAFYKWVTGEDLPALPSYGRPDA